MKGCGNSFHIPERMFFECDQDEGHNGPHQARIEGYETNIFRAPVVRRHSVVTVTWE